MQHGGVGLAILTDLRFREVCVRTYSSDLDVSSCGLCGFFVESALGCMVGGGGSKFRMDTGQGQEKF